MFVYIFVKSSLLYYFISVCQLKNFMTYIHFQHCHSEYKTGLKYSDNYNEIVIIHKFQHSNSCMMAAE